MHKESQVVRALTEESFDEVIKKESIVFVEFWAKWCVPCTQFSSVYEKVADQYPNIVFANVDVEAVPALSDLFEIRTVPYMMVFKEGIAIYSDAGVLPESVLKELADQAIAADVSDIRASLDEDVAS